MNGETLISGQQQDDSPHEPDGAFKKTGHGVYRLLIFLQQSGRNETDQNEGWKKVNHSDFFQMFHRG